MAADPQRRHGAILPQPQPANDCGESADELPDRVQRLVHRDRYKTKANEIPDQRQDESVFYLGYIHEDDCWGLLRACVVLIRTVENSLKFPVGGNAAGPSSSQ